MPDALRQEVATTRHCRLGDCVVALVEQDRAVVAGLLHDGGPIYSTVIRRQPNGAWSAVPAPEVAPPAAPALDLRTVPVEVRTVERRQLFVDGKPVGEPFE